MLKGEDGYTKEDVCAPFPQDPFKLALDLLAFADHFKEAQGSPQPIGNFMGNITLADPLVQETLTEAFGKRMQESGPLVEATKTYFEELTSLWQKTLQTPMGSHITPVITAPPEDRRFKDPEWEQNPYFSFMKQNYLLWDRWIKGIFTNIKGLSPHKQHQVDFYIRQIGDSLAPGNFPWSNPAALKMTLETGGANLLQGLESLFRDLEKGQGHLDIQMVDPKAFKVGENLATTPGKVVFQNDLYQLIQYTPITKTVFEYPVILVPPCINKFYVFDLRPENSFVRWLLDRGYTVFIVSWVNPDEELAHKTFEDYVLEGVGSAVEVARSICGTDAVNALGFCIGGNFLACLSGLYAAKGGPNPLRSTTYLASLFDFKEAGDLSVFIDPKQLKAIETRIKSKGFLEGNVLTRTFNVLRANDLVWSYVINNYYLGKTPAAFDFLYWNSDSTNLPANMYIYYLRHFYLQNKLVKPKGLHMGGFDIDLRKVKTPSFVFNAKDDHIAPWTCGFAGAHLFSGPKKFVLGASGHVVGVFNSPHNNKYCYWKSETLVKDPNEWLRRATQLPGSWWEEWATWLKGYGGEQVSARTPGSKKYPLLENAPGSYVIAAPGESSRATNR
jgi:polyhydroxyalkanoate synthase